MSLVSFRSSLFFLFSLAPLSASAANFQLGAGGGWTRLTYKEFDRSLGHWALSAQIDFSKYFGVNIEYLQTSHATGSTLPPGKLSFFPYILTTRVQEFGVSPVVQIKINRFVFFARPEISRVQVGHILSGGTALPDDPREWQWQTTTETRFSPCVGVTYNLGETISAGFEIKRRSAWRLEAVSGTAMFSVRF